MSIFTIIPIGIITKLCAASMVAGLVVLSVLRDLPGMINSRAFVTRWYMP